jgi:hypothetical protein
MELEEMKNLWQQQQQLVMAGNKTNEQLLRHLVETKVSGKMSRMLTFEYSSLALCTVLLLILSLVTHRLVFNADIAISYPICILTLLASILWSWYKIRLFGRIDMARQPVIEIKAQITRLRLLFHREMQWSMALMPVMILSFLSVVFFLVYGQSIMTHKSDFFLRGTAGIVVAWVALYFIYRHIYRPVFHKLLQDVEDIRDFGSGVL